MWRTLKVWLHCAVGLELTVFSKVFVLNRAFLPSANYSVFSLVIVLQVNTIQLLKQSHVLEITGTFENPVLAPDCFDL